MRKIVLFLGLLLPALASHAQTESESTGQTGFITDDLYTFIHAGPGRNYRILGSITAGTQVQKISDSEDNAYVEIVDDKERTGWVDARFFTADQSVRLRIPELESAIDESQSALQELRNVAGDLEAKLEQSQQQYRSMQEKYQALEQEYQSSQQQLKASDSKEQQEWLIKGGILAIGSLLLGVILTFLPKGRRRSDKWM